MFRALSIKNSANNGYSFYLSIFQSSVIVAHIFPVLNVYLAHFVILIWYQKRRGTELSFLDHFQIDINKFIRNFPIEQHHVDIPHLQFYSIFSS